MDRALELDQGNLPALIMKGDHLVATGNARSATAFYGLASAIATRVPKLTPTLAEMVRRTEAARDRINEDIERHLRAALAGHGYDESRSSPRFRHSLDLLTGRKRRYSQQPRAYYYPELPGTQFYPRDRFPWLGALEAATDSICDGLATVLKFRGSFVPYIQASTEGPVNRKHPLSRASTGAHTFSGGTARVYPVTRPLARRPWRRSRTSRSPHPRPDAVDSVLAAQTWRAHCTAHRVPELQADLPSPARRAARMPAACRQRGARVGRGERPGCSTTRSTTRQGIPATESRVILIFDIWHPDLTLNERSLISALMQAVDSYGGGQRVRWDD